MALYLQFFGKTTQYNYRAFGNFLAISQGILAYLIIFLIDKQTQKKKYTLEKQLAAEMIERVDERSAREAHTALIDMLVHEIKNPLATIRIAADNISIIPDNNRSARLNSLNKIFSNVQTVNEVLNQCVVSSQIYGPMAVGPYSQINLAHFLNIIANRNDAQDRVVLDIPSNLYIFSDTYALDIIVSNLISNAMKYGLASSPLVISISNVSVSSSGLIEIEFKNKIGESGVPDPFRVFRRYYRNELSINKSGTGLGLSLSKTLAQKLGGTLFFQPDEFNVIFKLKIPN
jgi:signal transduction histidine kinase